MKKKSISRWIEKTSLRGASLFDQYNVTLTPVIYRLMRRAGVMAYQLTQGLSPDIHPLLQDFGAKVLRGDAVAKAANLLKEKGFAHDVVVVHPGWGSVIIERYLA